MSPQPTIGAVVLAAGASRRFGSPKQLAVIDGRTLLEHAIDTASQAGLRPVVAVVPVWLTRPARVDSPDLRWVRNPFPERGLSHSLRLGLAALDDASLVDAVVVLLGDQPRVPTGQVTALIAARGERPVVASRADGVFAPPVLLERSAFALADRLQGDIGLHRLLASRAELVTPVEVGRHAPDVDTAADLARLTGA